MYVCMHFWHIYRHIHVRWRVTCDLPHICGDIYRHTYVLTHICGDVPYVICHSYVVICHTNVLPYKLSHTQLCPVSDTQTRICGDIFRHTHVATHMCGDVSHVVCHSYVVMCHTIVVTYKLLHTQFCLISGTQTHICGDIFRHTYVATHMCGDVSHVVCHSYVVMCHTIGVTYKIVAYTICVVCSHWHSYVVTYVCLCEHTTQIMTCIDTHVWSHTCVVTFCLVCSHRICLVHMCVTTCVCRFVTCIDTHMWWHTCVATFHMWFATHMWWHI